MDAVARQLVNCRVRSQDIKTSFLQARLGRNDEDPAEQGMSVWDAIRGVKLDIRGIGGSLDKAEHSLISMTSK